MENTCRVRTDSTPITSSGHRVPLFATINHHWPPYTQCPRVKELRPRPCCRGDVQWHRGGEWSGGGVVGGGLGWRGERVTFLQSAIWNPQDFILLLLHDGHDLSANVGDTAGLDHTCNTEGGRGRKGRG